MRISCRERRFPSATKLCDVFYTVYIPEEIQGGVLMVHGMSEHGGRYEELARFFAENGFIAAVPDLVSHGKSIKGGMPRGYFGEQEDWLPLLEDIRTLHELLQEEFPSLGWVLFGHSMGSILTQDFMARFGSEFEGYILSGTTGPNPAAAIAKIIARRQIKKGVGKEPSALLDKLCFGSFNKSVKNPATPCDWLSRDAQRVQKYMDDPLCGFAFTPWGYLDLFCATGRIASLNWAKQVPDRPVLLLAGDQDPVGQKGKGVKKVYRHLLSTGHAHVELRLYEGGRHEMHNETCRKDVFQDYLLFLESVEVGGEYEE